MPLPCSRALFYTQNCYRSRVKMTYCRVSVTRSVLSTATGSWDYNTPVGQAAETFGQVPW